MKEQKYHSKNNIFYQEPEESSERIYTNEDSNITTQRENTTQFLKSLFLFAITGTLVILLIIILF